MSYHAFKGMSDDMIHFKQTIERADKATQEEVHFKIPKKELIRLIRELNFDNYALKGLEITSNNPKPAQVLTPFPIDFKPKVEMSSSKDAVLDLDFRVKALEEMCGDVRIGDLVKRIKALEAFKPHVFD